MDSRQLSKKTALSKLRSHQYAPHELWENIQKRDKVALGKAITLIESTLPEHRILAEELLNLCMQKASSSLRIGITGVPGVGKSTFINAYTQQLLAEGHKVAILAVDPSSQQTGGSILGDKTRMEDIFAHPDVLIRPSPAGETLGGVAGKTRETILLCEAAGFDRILVETVGVGQSETAVHKMTDIFLLLMLPGAGDELQGIKRGIMELADILIVHKSDGSNVEKSRTATADYKRALHLFPPTQSGWIPRVLSASSLENKGIPEIHEAIEAYYRHTVTNGYFQKNRQNQLRAWFQTALEQQFYWMLRHRTDLQELYEKLLEDVNTGRLTPIAAAQQIMSRIFR